MKTEFLDALVGDWTYEGRSVPDDAEGQETDYDDVFEILSSDTRRLTGRLVGQDGQWRDFTVTDYRRKD